MVDIDVRVQPRSSRNDVQIVDGAIKVWLTAPPTDGQANSALCALIADRVGVPKSAVEVVRGHTSRSKTLRVNGLSASEIADRLAEQ